MVPDSPVGQELSQLEKVLLLFSLGLLRGRRRRRVRVLRRRRRGRRSSAEASEKVERELQEALRSIARSSACQSGRHFWVCLVSLLSETAMASFVAL